MTQNSAPIIVCRNIKKFYGEGTSRVEALKGINLTISQGELRLLMGPSGSGKTTLISIIAGILSQDSGECLIKDVEISQLSDQMKTQFRAKNIGFVFQGFNLVPMFTTEENISVPLLLNGTPREEALSKASQLLKELGMGDKIGTYPHQLSGGQLQRIAIGRAMIHSPPFIVCDEPTSYLDHHTGIRIMELLRNMVKEKGVTLIVVTHDPRIMEYADQIDRLEDGVIVNTTRQES